MRLLTPRRVRENEAFIWKLADRQIDEFLPAGRVELFHGFGQPFALLVIADLLGVPGAPGGSRIYIMQGLQALHLELDTADGDR